MYLQSVHVQSTLEAPRGGTLSVPTLDIRVALDCRFVSLWEVKTYLVKF